MVANLCGWGLGDGIANPIDPHWPGDVLDLLLTQIVKSKWQPVANVVIDCIRNEHSTGVGQRFDPSSDINPVAIEVVVLDDHVAKIDANTELDAVIGSDTSVPLKQCLLHLDPAAYCINAARKFHQHAVPGGLHDLATMFGNFRIDKFAAESFETFKRAFLIRAHQPRISGHICGEDGSETAGLAHPISPVASRRPERRRARSSGVEES